VSRDQAWDLRGSRAARVAAEPPGGVVVAVASGKGGAGKSVLSVLIARALAASGRRTLLLDGVLEPGHLHVLLGVCAEFGPRALLDGDAPASALPVSVADGLWLVPGEAGGDVRDRLSAVDRARLLNRLTALADCADALVVDAGPGLDSALAAAAARATRLALVAVPEPAALSDAYAVVKVMTAQLPALPLSVIANRVADAREGRQVFERLDLASRRFLSRPLEYAGAVAERADVAAAVRRPGALLQVPVADAAEVAARLVAAADEALVHPGSRA